MNHISCVHCSVEEHLGCLQFLGIMNKSIINIVGHLSLWCGGTSFGYMPRSDITGSLMTTTNFLRKCQIYFQSACTNLQSPQKWGCVPLSSLSHLQQIGWIKKINSKKSVGSFTQMIMGWEEIRKITTLTVATNNKIYWCKSNQASKKTCMTRTSNPWRKKFKKIQEDRKISHAHVSVGLV